MLEAKTFCYHHFDGNVSIVSESMQKFRWKLPDVQLVLYKNLLKYVGLDQTGHMSFLTGQDRTHKFAGQVLPDRTESGLNFLNI